MYFAYWLPWWGLLLLAGSLGLLAWATYRQTLVPLAPRRRAALVLLRAATLLLLAALLFRPVALLPPGLHRDAIVAILVDASRSMRVADEGGRRRIDRAGELLQREILPDLSSAYQVETLTFGDVLAPGPPDRLTVDAGRSDLAGALRAVRERYRGRPLAGVVVLSDGNDTGATDPAVVVDRQGPPIVTIGIGSNAANDREVVDVSADEHVLAGSIVTITATVVSRGFGTAPIEVRLLANGQPAQVRRAGGTDGVAAQERFQVSPPTDVPTVYTVEIPAVPGEAVTENNRRSVLVGPPGRKRRLLFVQGAPGFEHGFIRRAWAEDPELEVDTVVRKGRNDQGADVFLVQADPSRSAALASGYPTTRRALFEYDAVVFGNVEWDFLEKDQLQMTADFASMRGGGVLVFGARSFAERSLAGTPLDEVLPVEVGGRYGAVSPTAGMGDEGGPENKVTLTDEGRTHPLMRLAAVAEESAKRWGALPALAAGADLGRSKPGAVVLATTKGTGGVLRPAVAVQRYGRGRSMIFGGEASWRWRMTMAANDRTFEQFWRQAARWLVSASPERVAIGVLDDVQPGETRDVDVTAADEELQPMRDASLSMRVVQPGGETLDAKPTQVDGRTGLYRAPIRFARSGLYRVSVEARQGSRVVATAERWTLVGAVDREVADPRQNRDVLIRVASASGGRYLPAADARGLSRLLAGSRPSTQPPARRDLWQNRWTFGAVVLLLCTEWILRRRWGLR